MTVHTEIWGKNTHTHTQKSSNSHIQRDMNENRLDKIGVSWPHHKANISICARKQYLSNSFWYLWQMINKLEISIGVSLRSTVFSTAEENPSKRGRVIAKERVRICGLEADTMNRWFEFQKTSRYFLWYFSNRKALNLIQWSYETRQSIHGK